MNLISKTLIAITLLLSFNLCWAQIKNATTGKVKIYGNCGMCEAAIEKAGNINKIAKVDWDKDTNIATLTYDEKQTSQEAILKRIALAGYDSEKFLAPEDAYSKLPGCCQYERQAKTPLKKEVHTMKMENTAPMPVKQDSNQLQPILDNYFAVKDALVKTDGNTAAEKAKEMLTAINNIRMEKLEMDVHVVWMKVVENLKDDAEHISDTKDAGHQRDHFMTLSKSIYDLIKAAKQETPIFYQFCPMANDGKGANWLSKENSIKNPYYGSQMLTCGKTVETIK